MSNKEAFKIFQVSQLTNRVKFPIFVPDPTEHQFNVKYQSVYVIYPLYST